MNKLNKRETIVYMIIIAVILLSLVFVVHMNRKADLSGNVERRAYAELKLSIENHETYTKKLIEQEFDTLHTLAAYFGLKENFDFRNELEIANAVVLENHYCSLGYIELDGNAVKYTGESVGNLSEEKFFVDATNWMGEDAIEFKLTTSSVNEPRILLASPVRHKNVLIGVLYASMEVEDFNNKLASNNFEGNENVFVTDSKGNVIMSNQTSEEHVVGTNLFESHDKDHFMEGYSYEQLLSDIGKGKDGQFQFMHGEPEYVAFTSMGISDWIIYSMVPTQIANEQFSSNKAHVDNIVKAFTIAFLIAITIVCVMILIWNWQYIHCCKKHSKEKEKRNSFLGQIGRASYEYDVTDKLPIHGDDKTKVDVIHSDNRTDREVVVSEGTVQKKKIEVRTFGNFDLFVDGVPIHFTSNKAKELLAILIDRKGGTLSSEEAISILWEDEPAGEKQLARYRKMASRLKEVLEKAGCGEIMVTDNGIRSIDVTKIECDYYKALDGDEKAIKQYQGEYMINYSWAENKTAALNQLFGFEAFL